MTNSRQDGPYSKSTIWFESRELLEPDEWERSESEPFETLLETHLANGKTFKSEHSFVETLMNSPLSNNNNNKKASSLAAATRKRFKPIHQVVPSEGVPIFERNASIVRDTSAELILNLQDGLLKTLERIGDMDERLQRIEKLQAMSRRFEDNDNGESASRGGFWSSAVSQIVWFAWPIVLMTVLRRYWTAAEPATRSFSSALLSS